MKYLNDVSYKDCVGKICKSKSSGDFKIVKYNNNTNVQIQFLKTGYETKVHLGSIKIGSVKDPYAPSVYGVGITGTKYPSKVDGVLTKEYNLWQSMLERCYSTNLKKRQPTYEYCEVSENFKSYEYFYEWCNKQVGFNNKDWHLDKDLLIKGNKVYSEDTCCFVPQEINLSVVTRKDYRGEYPVGVGYKPLRKQYRARCNKFGKNVHLGWFSTAEDAFYAYKKAKELYLKELANKWKDQIDPRAYNALMNYQVEITD